MKKSKVLAASILGIEDKIKTVKKLISYGVEWIHYDVMDGEFVNNNSLPYDESRSIVEHTPKHTKEFHLMVNTPYEKIAEYLEIGDYFTFHYESTNAYEIQRILTDFEGAKIGIAISPDTDVKLLKPIIHQLSHVLVMSVIPGKGGQTFIHSVLNKVKWLKKLQEKNDFFIGIDGGINNTTAKISIEAGVNVLVSGSYLCNDISTKNVKSLIG